MGHQYCFRKRKFLAFEVNEVSERMGESDAFSPSIQTRQRARHLFILNKKYIKCLKLFSQRGKN